MKELTLNNGLVAEIEMIAGMRMTVRIRGLAVCCIEGPVTYESAERAARCYDGAEGLARSNRRSSKKSCGSRRKSKRTVGS